MTPQPQALPSTNAPSAVVLLGVQRFNPTLSEAVKALGATGRMAVITAGWQEREAEDDELGSHLGGRIVNLRLHARGEELFAEDPELRAAHRDRQDALRHRQDFYRIRLEHALEADQVIGLRAAPPEIAIDEAEISIGAIRELDRTHLLGCAKEHARFEERVQAATRPSVLRHREELSRILVGCDSIGIAGGHVATVINRLSLFGIGQLAAGKAVFAWSGGAMALTSRIVLFHDQPPQGPGATEVLDAGLCLAPGVVALPQPEQRLHLDQQVRLDRMVRRFSPDRCLLLPSRSWALLRGGKVEQSDGVSELLPGGAHQLLPGDHQQPPPHKKGPALSPRKGARR
jgi:hypothetical protein